MARSAARSTRPEASARPAGRGAISTAPVRRIRGSSNITELFDLGGRFDRNELSTAEINRLRNMIDSDGLPHVAELLGVSRDPLLFVCAGFGHRLQRKTAAKIRDFFHK